MLNKLPLLKTLTLLLLLGVIVISFSSGASLEHLTLLKKKINSSVHLGHTCTLCCVMLPCKDIKGRAADCPSSVLSYCTWK